MPAVGSKVLHYDRKKSVRWFAKQVSRATPDQLVALERRGVEGVLIKHLAKDMALRHSRIFKILGVSRATAYTKASPGKVISGAGGHAALGIVKLLGIAQSIVGKSTSSEAEGFDTAKWLGIWIERRQPSLGGKKPSEFLDTPTGIEMVARLLGAIESGAYL